MVCIALGRLLTDTCTSCIQEPSVSMHKMSGDMQEHTVFSPYPGYK